MNYDDYKSNLPMPHAPDYRKVRVSVIDDTNELVLSNIITHPLNFNVDINAMLVEYLHNHVDGKVCTVDHSHHTWDFPYRKGQAIDGLKFGNDEIRYRLGGSIDWYMVEGISVQFNVVSGYVSEYHRLLEEYQTEYQSNIQRFKQDLFDELSISDNPKRELLYAKAWDHGHSAGLYDVYNVAQDLVELIE